MTTSTIRYLATQTILTGLGDGGNLSWTTGRPDEWNVFTACYVYYADGTAQEVIFPTTISMVDFVDTVRAMHVGSTGKSIVNVVMD